MATYEENVLHKDKFLNSIMRKRSLQTSKTERTEPVLGPMGMYETLSGHDLAADDSLYEAFGDLNGNQFKVYLKNLELFKKKVRLKTDQEFIKKT